MAVKLIGKDGWVATGEHIALLRLLTLRSALRLESQGVRRRGRSALSIVKQEFGLTGQRARVLAQFDALVEKEKARLAPLPAPRGADVAQWLFDGMGKEKGHGDA